MVPPGDSGDPAAPAADGPEDAHAHDEAWFPQSDRPSPNVPPMVTISTTPDLGDVPTWTGRRAAPDATYPDDPAGDPAGDSDSAGDDWLVGDEDLAAPPARTVPAGPPTVVVSPPTSAVPTTAPPTAAVPTLVVTPPAPKVLAADPVGTIHRHHRRPSMERVVSWSSALVGAGGILLGLMLALLNVEKWPDAGTCQAYKSAHHHGAFGCGGTRGMATALPLVVTAVLVVGILAVVWIPHHTARRRLELIAGLGALLVATALVEALVYAALP
ncbi:MAG TPA: hypothetical protein VHE83_09505 [Mycobacteriales bacterium]|nr:hypothetical protein [Mycobacteriales bacterium]